MPADPKRKATIDEFGELARKVAEFRPTVDRYRELEQVIQSWFQDHSADESFVEAGDRYSVQVSARKRERKVFDLPKLYRILKRDLFFRVARVNLADVDKFVPTGRVGEVVSEARTGKRAVTPVLLSATAKRAA